MAVSIRLKREGRRNRATYRVVVIDKRDPRDGKYLEQVGVYDPLKKENSFSINRERIEHWMKQGAQPSATVLSFLKKSPKNA
ncbi:MAG: 30S ribosomal protein S16 [bacterium]